MAKHNNVVRFYINDDDFITRCDFFEEKEYLERVPIHLPQEVLIRLLKKYMADSKIYHEEKIFDNEILIKCYDVDKFELLRIIKNEKSFEPYIETQKSEPSKFKQNMAPQKQQPNNKKTNRKVNRKNRFNGRVVIASAFVLALLLTFALNGIKGSSEELPEFDSEQIQTLVTENDIKTSKGPISYEVNPTPTILEPDVPMETLAPVEEEVKYDQYILVETEDWTTTDKYINAKENYYDLITKYAKMYGIDPQIALAIACHERGTHSREVDSGGGIGLYQIQIEGGFNWDNKDVIAYNFDTQSTETVTVHKDDVRNLEQNIKVGLMIFQESLRRNDYDIARAIQEYNYGYGNLRAVLDRCYTDSNPLTENNKLEWLSYRGIISGGDPFYIENVLKYVQDEAVFEFMKKDGTVITCKYDNLLHENQLK